MMVKQKILNSILFSFIILKTFELLAGAYSVGFYIDEPYHHEQARDFLKNGTYINSESTDHAYTYGPVFGVLAHTLNAIFTPAKWLEFRYDPTAYTINHLAVAGTSLFTIFLVGFIVFLLTKDKFISITSSLILFSFPFWVGHSFYNVKDIPVAAGMTSLLAGSIYFIHKKEIKTNKKYLVVGFSLVLIGTLFSAGNRPLFIAYVALIALLTLYFLIKSQHAWKQYLFSVLSSILILSIFLPHFYANPIDSIRKTFFTSSVFPWQGSILMNGALVEPQATFSYFIWWFLVQTPIILIILAIVGLTISTKSFKNILPFRISGIQFSYLLISVQVFAVPLLAILLDSTVYQGLRHFMFVFPAIAIFLGLSLNKFLIIIICRIKIITVSIFFILLLIPNVVALRLFPYHANYYNSFVVASSNIPLDWETESMGISGREAIKNTPSESTLIFWETVWDEDPYISERAKSVDKEPKQQLGDYWAVSSLASYIGGDSRERALESGAVFESLRATCTLHHVVKRQLFNQTIPMAHVSRCQRSGSYQNSVASIGWSGESEVDENNKKFTWITSSGEAIRISTLRDFKTTGELKFDISANPCSLPTELRITQGKKFSEVINITTNNITESVTIPIELKPYSFNEIRIKTTKNNFCKIENDDREFVAKISNISWVEN